jgi:threonyl-tRNA synthetase
VLNLTEELLSNFGFTDYEIMLSTRPEKAVGSDEIWDDATKALREALDLKGWEYGIDEGGGAFYGPKIDLKIKDAIGRSWQCSTIQVCASSCATLSRHTCLCITFPSRKLTGLLEWNIMEFTTQVDFNLPERFALSYNDSDQKKRRPIMIHRAIFGSLERFFGVLTENYAGDFPLWLAPVQVAALSHTFLRLWVRVHRTQPRGSLQLTTQNYTNQAPAPAPAPAPPPPPTPASRLRTAAVVLR